MWEEAVKSRPVSGEWGEGCLQSREPGEDAEQEN